MLSQLRARINPKRLYIEIEVAMAFWVAIAYTTSVVYWVRSGHLNSLQLILLGTAVEVSYFVFQLPAGILADIVSRRLCVIVARFLVGAGFLMQGLSAHFGVLLIAQLPIGVGVALGYGAQEAWLADESGEDELTSVFLRATQLGLIGTIAGSLLSGLLGLWGLNVPFLVSGSLSCVLGVYLICVMPEQNFSRPERAADARGVLRDGWKSAAAQMKQTRVAMLAVPGLLLMLGMMFFLGMWGESFDRLWGAYLLRDIRFPDVLGLHVVVWFSIFAVAAAMLSLGSTEWASRRTDKLGPNSVVSTLLTLTIVTGAAVVLMAATHLFVVVVVAYLAVATMQPVFSPLTTGWIVARVDPGVRATALSAADMFDSGGQMVGGPIIGAVGVLTSIRVALLAGGLALAPAAGLLAAATRRVKIQGDPAGQSARNEAAVDTNSLSG
jgi:MFS transporter, DHA3 family, tetracycline resistance protein